MPRDLQWSFVHNYCTVLIRILLWIEHDPCLTASASTDLHVYPRGDLETPPRSRAKNGSTGLLCAGEFDVRIQKAVCYGERVWFFFFFLQSPARSLAYKAQCFLFSLYS